MYLIVYYLFNWMHIYILLIIYYLLTSIYFLTVYSSIYLNSYLLIMSKLDFSHFILSNIFSTLQYNEAVSRSRGFPPVSTL